MAADLQSVVEGVREGKGLFTIGVAEEAGTSQCSERSIILTNISKQDPNLSLQCDASFAPLSIVHELLLFCHSSGLVSPNCCILSARYCSTLSSRRLILRMSERPIPT